MAQRKPLREREIKNLNQDYVVREEIRNNQRGLQNLPAK